MKEYTFTLRHGGGSAFQFPASVPAGAVALGIISSTLSGDGTPPDIAGQDGRTVYVSGDFGPGNYTVIYGVAAVTAPVAAPAGPAVTVPTPITAPTPTAPAPVYTAPVYVAPISTPTPATSLAADDQSELTPYYSLDNWRTQTGVNVPQGSISTVQAPAPAPAPSYSAPVTVSSQPVALPVNPLQPDGPTITGTWNSPAGPMIEVGGEWIPDPTYSNAGGEPVAPSQGFPWWIVIGLGAALLG